MNGTSSRNGSSTTNCILTMYDGWSRSLVCTMSTSKAVPLKHLRISFAVSFTSVFHCVCLAYLSFVDVFQPLFEVTRDPTARPELHVFLQRVVGFDSVDDESKAERRFHKKFPYPRLWDAKESPPYSYWLYYLFANIASLNHFRRARGFSAS